MGPLFGVLAFLVFVAMIVGLIKPSWVKAKDRKLVFLGFGFLFIVFLIVASVSTPSSPSSAGTNSQPQQEAMDLDVRQSTLAATMGTNSYDYSPVLSIQNLNSHDWSDCTVKLNGEYSSPLHNIYMPNEIDNSSTNPLQQGMVIELASFVRSDGTRFDPITQEPLKVEVDCNQPYGDAWLGNFGE